MGWTSLAWAIGILAGAKCLAGFVAGVTGGELGAVNAGGVPGFLPFFFSAFFGYVAIRCWRDGGLDARLLAVLWALAGSWLADRGIRSHWAGAGAIPVDGVILIAYLGYLKKRGLLRELARSTAAECRAIPRWVWRAAAALGVVLWSTPGAWLPVTAAIVYGVPAMAARATIGAMR